MSMQLENVVDALPAPPQPPQEARWLQVELSIGEQHSTLIADPLLLYTMAQQGIQAMLVGNEDVNASPEEKRLKQLVKTGIKGLFLTFGGKILDMLFQSKDHPKPGKGDDLIEWYSNIFAQIILTKCTDGVLILHAKGATYGQNRPIRVDEIRPISFADAESGHAGSTGTGAEALQPDTSTGGVG